MLQAKKVPRMHLSIIIKDLTKGVGFQCGAMGMSDAEAGSPAGKYSNGDTGPITHKTTLGRPSMSATMVPAG